MKTFRYSPVKLSFLWVIFVISGCATGGGIHSEDRVSTGWTKREVYEKLGDPDSVQSEGDQEILVYHFNDQAPNGTFVSHEYHVTLKDGKVARSERSDLK